MEMKEQSEIISQESCNIAFTQLLEQIRKQDDLVHSWTKYFLSIQSALAVALAFLINLQSSGDALLVKAGLLLLPVLGIATTWYLTNIIVRETQWQGRYITALRRLKGMPQIWDRDPDPNKPGYIAGQFIRLRRVLVAIWIVVLIVLIYSILAGFIPAISIL
jgi:hypothetical protein